MSKKETAVEWLVDRLNQCEPMYSFNESNEFKFYIDNLIEKAKNMEKEQIIEAWDVAHQAGRFEGKGIAEENVNACIQILTHYIENNKDMRGTSVTTAVGEIVIKNKMWQIQIRLECDDIISTTEIFESVKLFGNEKSENNQ